MSFCVKLRTFGPGHKIMIEGVCGNGFGLDFLANEQTIFHHDSDVMHHKIQVRIEYYDNAIIIIINKQVNSTITYRQSFDHIDALRLSDSLKVTLLEIVKPIYGERLV